MKRIVKITIGLMLIISHLVNVSPYYALTYNILILLFIVTALVGFWKSREPFSINIPEITVGIFALYLFVSNMFQSTFIGNDTLHKYLIVLLSYFGFKVLYLRDKSISQYIFYGILAGLSIEVLISFGQLFGLVQNSDTKFIIGGLFGNPGALAGFLSISAPFLLVIILNYKKIFQSENFYYTILCSFLCAIYLIISSNSRGAWIASFVGIIFALDHKYKLSRHILSVLKTKTLKISGIIASLLIVTIVSTALYNYKQDSAFGRLFIWKTSLPMVAENPVFGSGFGSFANDYGKVQATYFLEKTPPKQEVQVADYVTCAYNEFLEMLIDSGIVGLLLLFAIIYFALKTQQNNHSEYHFAAKYSLIALLILSMVSYPLGLMPNVLMLVVTLFIIFNNGNYRTFQIRKLSKLLPLIWFMLMVGLIYLNSTQIYGIYHFQKGYKKIIANDLKSGLEDYAYACNFLNNDGIFQFHYGSALNLNENYDESINHLIRATELNSNPNAFITLGNSLKRLQRYKEAKKAYKTASGITPSKLYPKYLLANLYVKMDLNNDAVKMAQEIIEMNEKRRTTAGNEIKQEMQQLIEKQYIE